MRIIKPRDIEYPDLLRFINDPPKTLYTKGDLIDRLNREARLTLAIVGSRRATRYGLDMAFAIARDLAKYGLTIVSGLAEGIDSAAHKGAVDEAGGTIAVLGCGLDVYYPALNRRLQDKIAQQGSIISEFPPGTRPSGNQFPSRNRIISGLSTGVLVVEGAAKSGTLITADMALAQGRDVYALPGPATSRYSTTPNKLIKLGASLVESADDILDELNLTRLAKRDKLPQMKNVLNVSPEENIILSAITNTPKQINEIIYETGLQCETVSSILLVLETKRLASRTVDGDYVAF